MDDEPKICMCVVCQEFLGILIWVNDRYWLQIGSAQFSYTHGRCKHCKRLWTFDSEDFRLNRMIERVVKR
jgi:hypothetical protein